MPTRSRKKCSVWATRRPPLPKLPPKLLSHSADALAERQLELDAYLRRLSVHPSAQQPALAAFLSPEEYGTW